MVFGNDASRYAFGYTVQGDAGIALVSGGNIGVETSVVEFTDKTYGDYKYVYSWSHVGSSVGSQEGASLSIGGSVFVAYNNNNEKIKPSSFEGKTISVGGAVDLKAGTGLGLIINKFSGTGNWTDKGWHGVSIGVSAGIGESVNAGSATGTVSKTYLLNAAKPTAERSSLDRAINKNNPAISVILNPNPKYIGHTPQFD